MNLPEAAIESVYDYLEAIYPEEQSTKTLSCNLGVSVAHVQAALTQLRAAGRVLPTKRGRGATAPCIAHPRPA